MKKTTVLTIILALIWCMIIVLATLSPLAQTGGTSNQFGDMGMWADIGLILVLFLLPQYFYDKGSKGAKIVLSCYNWNIYFGSYGNFRISWFIFA
ncbi:MAG: DUF5391 family protein [[Clostridium] scindens]